MSATPTTLRGLNLVGVDGHVDGPFDIRVRGTLIEQVERTLPVGEGDDVDLGGVFALPGVFDCHTHLTLATQDVLANLRRTPTTRTLQAADAARRTLHAGVTFARDAGGADAGLRDGIAGGLIPGPQLQVSVVMISRTGGHSDGRLGGLDLELGIDGQVPSKTGPSHLVDSID